MCLHNTCCVIQLSTNSDYTVEWKAASSHLQDYKTILLWIHTVTFDIIMEQVNHPYQYSVWYNNCTT